MQKMQFWTLKSSDGASGAQGRPGRSYTDYAYHVCGGGGGVELQEELAVVVALSAVLGDLKEKM